jgi:hypothetical protein
MLNVEFKIIVVRGKLFIVDLGIKKEADRLLSPLNGIFVLRQTFLP